MKGLTRFIAVTFVSLLIAACGSKLTQENFGKISTGMTQAEVIQLLGEPQSSEGAGLLGLSASTAVWKDSKNQISIVFLNEKVTSKSFGAAAPAQ
jgi:hypothetical protein